MDAQRALAEKKTLVFTTLAVVLSSVNESEFFPDEPKAVAPLRFVFLRSAFATMRSNAARCLKSRAPFLTIRPFAGRTSCPARRNRSQRDWPFAIDLLPGHFFGKGFSSSLDFLCASYLSPTAAKSPSAFSGRQPNWVLAPSLFTPTKIVFRFTASRRMRPIPSARRKAERRLKGIWIFPR